MTTAKSPTKTRCAIYTRKSSDEGLDQEFNSLDAQYEACAAYIASQKHEGWRLVKKRYDDGGISGGTMERAGLQALLADIDAGLIDMIVVYKIDRLTRSLSDFSKIVDRLDAAGASFVSVTQSFNTATSMGRLTLNMLLSFAQFEREVTAERIRDKIAASKAKGMWMGGTVPLGYDPNPDKTMRGLVVNEEEAKSVTRIYALYEQLSNLSRVSQACMREGIRSKYRPQYQSRLKGESIMTNGQIHHILTNPIYIGKIKHKDNIYDGQHQAIIEEGLWESVQSKLQAASARKRGQIKDPKQSHHPLLVGKLYDETGDHLTPTHTKRNGKIIRYYISNRLIKAKDPSGWRLPAKAMEDTIVRVICEHLEKHSAKHQLLTEGGIEELQSASHKVDILINQLKQNDARVQLAGLIDRIELSKGDINIKLKMTQLADSLDVKETSLHPELTMFTKALHMRKRGVEQKLIIGEEKPSTDPKSTDPKIQHRLARAHHWVEQNWVEQIKSGKTITEIAQAEGKSPSFIRTRITLAFLAPKIQRAIMLGGLPIEITLEKLVRSKLPADWKAQEQRLGLQ